MISKIVRILIIFICIIVIAVIAVLSFRDEHRLSDIEKDVKVDFSAYHDINSIISAGKKHLFKGIEEFYESGDSADKGLKDIALARVYFKRVLKENDLNPEGLGYSGIITGILADFETDMMIKLNMMNRAFYSLDNAIKLNSKLSYVYFYRGVFSVETPDAIFHRLQKGVKDLELVLLRQNNSSFLNKYDFHSLLFYLGKGKILLDDMVGKQYLERVIKESNNKELIKRSRKYLYGKK